MENNSGFKKPRFSKSKWVLIFLVIAAAGTFFRLYPLTVNPREKRESLARTTLYLNLQNKIRGQIQISSPHLTNAERDKLARQRIQEIIKTEKSQFEKTVKNIAAQIPHQFYLLGADPYFYYYLTENIKNQGAISEEIRYGYYFDPLMMAPGGFWRKIEVHPYVGFAVYKIMSFLTEASLEQAAAWTPILLFFLTAAIFLYLCSLMKFKKISAFTGSLYFALSPIFLQRSAIGWYDTDPYILIFSLLTIIMIIKVEKSQNKYLPLFYLAATTALFSLFWEGWLTFVAFILLYFFSRLTGAFFGRAKNTPPLLILKQIIIYSSATCLLSLLILSPHGLFDSLKDTFQIFSGFFFLETTIWPDIFITVGELMVPGWRRFIHILGGYIFTFVSFAGALILLFSKQIKNRPKTAIILYFLIFFFFGKSSRRFILFFLPPAAITFTLALDQLQTKSAEFIEKLKTNKKKYLKAAAPALILLLPISPFIYAQNTARAMRPVYNYVWDDTLKEIKEKTPPESVINSWWPPGHFIKAASRRKVSFDGATLNTQPSYWIASSLMATDEEYTKGILRMLNSTGTKAPDFLLENNFPVAEAVSLLEKILPADKNKAKKIASKHLGPQKAKALISLTHCQPPPSYLLLYKDLVDGTIGLHYVSNWDFDKAALMEKERRKKIKRGGLKNLFWRGTSKQVSSMWEIAGGMPYVGERSFPVKMGERFIHFSNGVILDSGEMTARIENLEGRISGIPRSVIYLKNNNLEIKKLPQANVNLSVMVINSGPEGYSSLVSSQEILSSVLFRLFYLDGAGLNNFKKIIDNQDPRFNAKKIVYQIIF